ncbi:putative late gene antiterminator protein [Yersinia pseudotuberculosis]|nr:antiterminator Q family protein [Yersinia pseudotuberculosis]VEE71522.1 putative late gene antiterminator protein [Yersinia pseudotuberculosis]
MNVAQLKLTKEQHDWVNGWLELWGAWVYSGRLEKRMSSVIAQYMATVEPQGSPSRPMCNDDDHGNIPLASWQVGYARRSIVRFEQGFSVGALEEARTAKASLATAAEKRSSAAQSLDVSRNRVSI